MTIINRLTAALRPVASVVLALGFVSIPKLTTVAIAQTLDDDHPQDIVASRLAPNASSLDSQVYLFGDTPVRDQIGSSYMVMEVRDQTMVGAIYMPHSSFDCFQGEVEGDRLSLNITNSYDLTTYAYSMDLQSNGAVASAEPMASLAKPEGYHLIPSVTENDLRLLETCKAEY